MQLDIGAKIGKVWGWTMPLHQGQTTELQSLHVKQGFRCSNHLHKDKKNLFYVFSGRLKVIVEKDGLRDEVIIGPQEKTTVMPGQWHRFEALTDCYLIEFYWVDLDAGDIQRKDSGGMVDDLYDLKLDDGGK